MLNKLFIVLLAFGMSTAVLAESGEGGQPSRPPRPPKEALNVCSGKTSGTACSFTGPRSETLSGVCWSPDDKHPLACKPSNAPF